MGDDRKNEGKEERSAPAPQPRASIDLPRPTPDQAEYLSKLRAAERREYDERTVIGGPRRRKA